MECLEPLSLHFFTLSCHFILIIIANTSWIFIKQKHKSHTTTKKHTKNTIQLSKQINSVHANEPTYR